MALDISFPRVRVKFSLWPRHLQAFLGQRLEELRRDDEASRGVSVIAGELAPFERREGRGDRRHGADDTRGDPVTSKTLFCNRMSGGKCRPAFELSGLRVRVQSPIRKKWTSRPGPAAGVQYFARKRKRAAASCHTTKERS